jgi:hypothetical protein
MSPLKLKQDEDLKPLKLSLALTALLANATFASDITLYTDTKTGAIYATPGENRVLLGEFTQKVTSPKESVEEKKVVADVKQTQEVIKTQNSVEVDAQDGIPEGRLAQLKPSWADKLKIKGYMQFRTASFLEGADEGYKLWSDGSVNDDSSFFIRRARLIVHGKVGDHLSVYIQPDFASKGDHSGQLRDWYGDVFIDKQEVHRIRIGQSKVPYGFENMQSSSKRFALDRNDALNSAVRDERDIGAFYYYTPEHVQALFKEIDSKRLRGSGNYGMFGFGAYNGQGANQQDRNGDVHLVSRYAYPFKLDNGQLMEFGVQGYMGKYVPFNGDYIELSKVAGSNYAPIPGEGIEDERVGITAVIYPQPFGLQAEWNWGNTPGYDKDAEAIMKKSLNGGYVQLMHMVDDLLKAGDTFTTFAKWQYFDGYSKAEQNAPRNEVNDLELGTEWYPAKELRIQTIVHFMNRQDLTIRDPRKVTDEKFHGTAFRVQAQMNF